VPESFDLENFIDHVRTRSKLIVATCVIAAALAAGITLLIPRQFTATAKIIIEPPAGSDLRAAMAVSPIYLESLKTYEHFAGSDKLFSQALDHFRLRGQAPERSIEAWKSRILKISIPRNTKILEISATFPDPKKAHELAVYLAEETIKLNRAITREGDREFTQDAERQLEAAKIKRDKVDSEWRDLLSSDPVEVLRADIQGLEDRQYGAERESLDADSRAAELAGRQKALDPAASTQDVRDLRAGIASARARSEYLRTRVAGLETELAKKRALLARRMERREEIETRRRSAQAAYEAMLTRTREIEGAIGYRGERLKLIDPGIVPEKPTSPRTMLNIGAALLLGLVLSLFYVAIEFVYGKDRRPSPPVALRQTGTRL
jgi:uncharacterized protein involved in exopolysaccharide biosynthesis